MASIRADISSSWPVKNCQEMSLRQRYALTLCGRESFLNDTVSARMIDFDRPLQKRAHAPSEKKKTWRPHNLTARQKKRGGFETVLSKPTVGAVVIQSLIALTAPQIITCRFTRLPPPSMKSWKNKLRSSKSWVHLLIYHWLVCLKSQMVSFKTFVLGRKDKLSGFLQSVLMQYAQYM